MKSLSLARNELADAVTALTGPQYCDGHQLDSRYAQLRDAITEARVSGHTRTPAASIIPAQIDCLKLAILIDGRTAILTRGQKPRAITTTARLQLLTVTRWRPQDVEHLQHLSAEIESWAKAIDDLFAPKPLELPNPCPQCGHTWTHRKNDEGDTVRARTLAVTTAGAQCRQCHTKWPPEDLMFFGRVLGYRLTEITA